jgi:hypothetical protein
MADSDKPASPAEHSYVLVARDYADIAHLENPSAIERILSASRTEKVAYVSALLTSGLSKYALAGPKVAFAAAAVEALTDFGKEVSKWIKDGKIPEDFSGRPSGYQTWVELLQEIDSNPIDADRLKAMKAMFLAANIVSATDGESILAYQLFQIAKNLNSGPLMLLKAVYSSYETYSKGPRTGGSIETPQWRTMMANSIGHKLSALVGRDERKLVEYGLIAPWIRTDELLVPLMDGRMTDLGIKFCRNLESYGSTVSEGR